MPFPPLLTFHISMGVLGLLSGAVALALRKGSLRHRAAGTVFVVAMVSLTTTAMYLGLAKHEMGSCLIALLTLYLVATAWRTARRRDGRADVFELGALLAALALAAGFAMLGVEAASSPTGTKDGHHALKYFVFALVAVFSGAGDLRMLLRGGVLGPQRIARHLWRMTFPLLIAANTFFQGQARLFPVELRRAHALYLPIVLIIGTSTFWIVRVLFVREDGRRPTTFHWLRSEGIASASATTANRPQHGASSACDASAAPSAGARSRTQGMAS